MKTINLYKACICKNTYRPKYYYVGAESFEQAFILFEKMIKGTTLKIYFIKEESDYLLIEK